jgi:uncharacterized protein YkwD
MTWLKTGGIAALLVLASVGGASLLGYDVTVQPESPTPQTQPATGSVESGAETRSPTSTDRPESAGYDQNRVRELFYQRLNEFRAERDRAALRGSPAVARVAEAHSEDMAQNGFFSHENPAGEGPQERLRKGAVSCTRSGENIAQTWWREQLGETDGPSYIDSDADLARALLVQWANSPGHREVMLLRGIDDVGLGLAQTADGRIYATLNLC